MTTNIKFMRDQFKSGHLEEISGPYITWEGVNCPNCNANSARIIYFHKDTYIICFECDLVNSLSKSSSLYINEIHFKQEYNKLGEEYGF